MARSRRAAFRARFSAASAPSASAPSATARARPAAPAASSSAAVRPVWPSATRPFHSVLSKTNSAFSASSPGASSSASRTAPYLRVEAGRGDAARAEAEKSRDCRTPRSGPFLVAVYVNRVEGPVVAGPQVPASIIPSEQIAAPPRQDSGEFGGGRKTAVSGGAGLRRRVGTRPGPRRRSRCPPTRQARPRNASAPAPPPPRRGRPARVDLARRRPFSIFFRGVGPTGAILSKDAEKAPLGPSAVTTRSDVADASHKVP